MRLVKRFVDLLLYSNIWIGLCALSMQLQTRYVILGEISMDEISWFVLFGTISLYAFHRVWGIKKLADQMQSGRYMVIYRQRLHIIIYGAIAFIIALFFFFRLPFHVMLWFLPALTLSALYVLPVFGENKRLRDMNLIKIFVIALSWSWITGLVPAIQYGENGILELLSLYLERIFFIIAITIPFDIRDYKVDQWTEVKTLPLIWGVEKSKKVAYGFIILAAFFIIVNFYLEFYTLNQLIGMGLAYFLTICLIHGASQERQDYYYSGLMDGTMILQFAIIFVTNFLK